MKKLIKILSLVIITSISAQASEVGRYQFIINSQFRSESVILDTVTGKIWQRSCVASISKANPTADNCAISAWVAQDVVGINVNEKTFWKNVAAYEASHP